MEAYSISPSQTKKIAADLAKDLKGGDVIALFGDLGAGKTVFTKGLAQGLKVKRKITSPTFVFMKTYSCPSGFMLYHLDLYRLENPQDFENLGMNEIFSKKNIVILEWAQKVKELLPKDAIEVLIKKIDEKTRKIQIDRRF